MLPPDSTLTEVLRLFSDGGPVMFMLAFIAAILYTTAAASVFFVSKGNLKAAQKEDWVEWINNPDAGEGRAGEIIRYAMHGPRISIKTVQRRFDEVREVVITPPFLSFP